jgi:hypothetical protein
MQNKSAKDSLPSMDSNLSKSTDKNTPSKRRKLFIFLAVLAVLFLIIIISIGIFFIINREEIPESDDTSDVPDEAQTMHVGDEIWVEEIDSDYEVEQDTTPLSFETALSADIMLSGIDFNNTGGPLLFNHVGHIASDETHLILADRNNNRVLIWNSLPTSNTSPDIVLGQKDFTSNNPGDGMDNLNWPISVATDGERIFVADTYNDRILIWNSFPTSNGQPADVVLQNESGDQVTLNQEGALGWPWDVWTDGEKLIVASTGTQQVLVWDHVPEQSYQAADLSLKIDGFGTPRTIGSDGTRLVIGDHNAFQDQRGNFFWNTFPTTSNQPYDFFISSPSSIGQEDNRGGPPMGDHMASLFTEEGEFLMLGNSGLHIWNSFPQDENDAPDVSMSENSQESNGFEFKNGDGSGMVYENGILYLSLSNSNMVLGFNGIPDDESTEPDFAVGSDDMNVNTLDKNFFITNPAPATNGTNLFVSSDFDRKLYVWKNIPAESGVKPDFVYHNAGGWDNALYDETFILAGQETVYVWEELPLEKNLPDLEFRLEIGNAQLQEIKGVAIDDRYFYLSDSMADKVYIWEGIPDEDSNPMYTLDIEDPWRLSSDGEYLAVTEIYNHRITLYKIDDLSNNVQPDGIIGGQGTFNLPQGVILSKGHLFIGDTGFNRIHIWTDVDNAISGADADLILGAAPGEEGTPLIGKDELFWPTACAFDGTHLWVGEFKFSGRLLRY